ncbi:MAG: lipopolysaccharide biosynthesis protein [Desulfobulbaceae bacterium]|nr:lipopolysaccharide biosynthesis protein [Desulfobulbaceae bacterium]
MNRLNPDIIFKHSSLSRDLAGASIRGGISTMTSQGMQIVLQMTGTIILARLLTPADYGLIGMVTVVVNFAQMFKDAGLSVATVQKDKISHEQISTLFWVNVFISVVLGGCVLVGSPLVAKFYGKPELAAVTAVLSISFIASGLGVQHGALLLRHMRFGNLAFIQIMSQMMTLSVTIILALLGMRYWALVGGALTTAFCTVTLTFYFCPWIPGRIQKRSGVRDMLKFGGHITGFEFINYFSRNFDNILIGRFIGADALGFYSKAYYLFMLPITQIRTPINNVALPVLRTLKEEPGRYAQYYQRILDILSSITIPLTFYCIIEAEFIIELILGSQWSAVVPVFRILAIAGVIQPIAGTRGLILLSLGFSRKYLNWGVFNSALIVIAFIIGLPYGIKGVATAYTAANYIILVPSLFYCFHGTPITVSLFFKTVALPFLTSCLVAVVIVLVKSIIIHDLIFFHFWIIAIFFIAYVALSSLRQSVRHTIYLIVKNIIFYIKDRSCVS